MLQKPNDIIDRRREWNSLWRLAESPRGELAFVVGRRRVGKSFVLARFTTAVGGIYYQATRRTEREQLLSLSRLLGDHFADSALMHGDGFSSWEGVLAYVTEKAPPLLVIDEFPYLVETTPSLPSLLQSFWDHQWKEGGLKIVLSGSYISAMERLEAVDQPLYGRRTARIIFPPFSPQDAAQFVPDYTPRDRLTAWSTFGNLPGNLSLLDPDRSIGENIGDQILNPSGRLVDDAQHLLDPFVSEGGVYYSILEAIASGEETWKGITRRVGRSGGALSRPLEWLESMGLIRRVVPITEKNPAKSKRTLYRIADPYLLFWHSQVAPLLRAGSIGQVSPERLWQSVIAPRLDNHMGAHFEEACREFVRNSEKLPFLPVRTGEWWNVTSDAQVDVVAIGADGELLVGEVKWGPVRSSHVLTLSERAKMIAAELGGITTTHLALFTGREPSVPPGAPLIFTLTDIV